MHNVHLLKMTRQPSRRLCSPVARSLALLGLHLQFLSGEIFPKFAHDISSDFTAISPFPFTIFSWNHKCYCVGPGMEFTLQKINLNVCKNVSSLIYYFVFFTWHGIFDIVDIVLLDVSNYALQWWQFHVHMNPTLLYNSGNFMYVLIK